MSSSCGKRKAFAVWSYSYVRACVCMCVEGGGGRQGGSWGRGYLERRAMVPLAAAYALRLLLGKNLLEDVGLKHLLQHCGDRLLGVRWWTKEALFARLHAVTVAVLGYGVANDPAE